MFCLFIKAVDVQRWNCTSETNLNAVNNDNTVQKGPIRCLSWLYEMLKQFSLMACFINSIRL